MLVEVLTFQLVPGVDEAIFLEADERVQALVSSREGFVRRTTARGDDAEWLVLSFWWTAAHADAAPTDDGFTALVDAGSLRRRRYETLD